jgi:NAD-dependent aldehyde dehydrogenases
MPLTIDELIQRARSAQREIEYWPQDKVDLMVAAAGWETYKNSEKIARLAVDETSMGVYEHKVLKHQKKTLGTLRDMQGVKTVGVIEENPQKGLIKVAKPVGVIGALTPVTNCEATLPSKSLPALKCRNAIIFAPHPHAKQTAALVVSTLREGLRKAGAPLDLIQTIEEPSVELSKELMSKVDLVIATGGGPMVKSAYSSGTPAYGVGAGNAVVIVDETADLPAAAEKICQARFSTMLLPVRRKTRSRCRQAFTSACWIASRPWEGTGAARRSALNCSKPCGRMACT